MCKITGNVCGEASPLSGAFQYDWSTPSEDMYALLARVTTACLNITFRRRDVARKMLETITLKPFAEVKLTEKSKGLDK